MTPTNDNMTPLAARAYAEVTAQLRRRRVAGASSIIINGETVLRNAAPALH